MLVVRKENFGQRLKFYLRNSLLVSMLTRLKNSIYNISLVLFLYAICRGLFLYFNQTHFDSTNIPSLFLYGLRFDISSVILLNSLYILLVILFAIYEQKWQQAALKYLFLISNGIGLLVNLIDVVYFPFIHKRMQFDAFRFLTGSKGNEFFTLLPTFLVQYWYIWLLFLAMMVLLCNAYQPLHKLPKFNFFVWIGTFVFSVGLSVLAIRGGLQLKPLNIIHASELTSAQNIPVIINTPFSLSHTINKRHLDKLNYFSENELGECYQNFHKNAPNQPFSKKNVVIIIVESLSKKYVAYLGGEGKTPFLDSLFANSLVFSNGFANGRESIQGIPSILSSIPSWQDDPFIFSPYSGNKITSIASILKQEGYQTMFFHGGSNGTMGFNSYSKLAEFEHYYGRNEYKNEQDFDGKWGIWDEPFLQFMGKKLSETSQPFVASVFTLNTHHPFVIPQKYQQRFKQEGHPMLTCVSYADYALQQFFESIKHTDWYKNTLFVITADHAAPNFGKEKSSLTDDYQIPIVFFSPDGSLKKMDETIANQIDILPTILEILHYPKPYFSFGKSLLNKNCEHFSINYNAGIYQYINTNYCYQFNGKNAIGLYNWKNDKYFVQNLLRKSPQQAYTSMDESLKKSIQLFNKAMIENKMR